MPSADVLRAIAETAGLDPDDDRRVLVALENAWEKGAACADNPGPRFKLGDLVNYHPIIGGPAKSRHRIREVQPEGTPSHREPIYWLTDKNGFVAEAALSPATERLFYMQDTRTIVGNCISWWAKDHRGYTCHLERAHVFTEEEAVQIARGRETDVPWPKDVIDEIAGRMVDHQRLPDRAQLGDLRSDDEVVLGVISNEPGLSWRAIHDRVDLSKVRAGKAIRSLINAGLIELRRQVKSDGRYRAGYFPKELGDLPGGER